MEHSESNRVAVIGCPSLQEDAEEKLKAALRATHANIKFWDPPDLYSPFKAWDFRYWWPLVQGHMVWFLGRPRELTSWMSLIRLRLLSDREIRDGRLRVCVVCKVVDKDTAFMKFAERSGFTVVDETQKGLLTYINRPQETTLKLKFSLEEQYRACLHSFVHAIRTDDNWTNNRKFVVNMLDRLYKDFNKMEALPDELCKVTIDVIEKEQPFDMLRYKWDKFETQCALSNINMTEWIEKEMRKK